jgi:hypothetical protein
MWMGAIAALCPKARGARHRRKEEKENGKVGAYAENRRMTLAMTKEMLEAVYRRNRARQRTVESYNAEDEDDGKRHDDDGVDLEPRRLISV